MEDNKEVTPTPAKEVKSPELIKAEKSLLALTKKLMAGATDEAGVAKLLAFRADLLAARSCVSKFNKALEVMRDFRGEDFAPGVEPIVLRATGDNKGGAKPMTEEQRLKNLLG